MFLLNNLDLCLCGFFCFDCLELFYKIDFSLLDLLVRIEYLQLFFKVVLGLSVTQFSRFNNFDCTLLNSLILELFLIELQLVSKRLEFYSIALVILIDWSLNSTSVWLVLECRWIWFNRATLRTLWGLLSSNCIRITRFNHSFFAFTNLVSHIFSNLPWIFFNVCMWVFSAVLLQIEFLKIIKIIDFFWDPLAFKCRILTSSNDVLFVFA